MKLFIFALLLLTSCRYETSNSSNSKIIKFDKIEIDSAHIFNSNEMSLVKNICTLLKNKRELFDQYDDMKKAFYFHVNYTNCDGRLELNKDFIAKISNVNSTDMEYVASEVNYIKEIITDQSNGLKYLCDNKYSNNLSNTVVEGNLSTSLQVDIIDNYYVVNMVKSKKDSNGKFIPKRAESITFISNIFQGSESQFGIERNIDRYSTCENGKTSLVSQRFINDAL